MNLIKKVLLKKKYKAIEDEWEFIWGIKSYDDLTINVANLYTMNDLSIEYNKHEKKYYLSIETIYRFEDERGKSLYIQDLYERFTQYMYDRNLSVNKELNMCDIFSGINLKADDLETLYAQFKFLVSGYCGVI